jgi:hypothetical protein
MSSESEPYSFKGPDKRHFIPRVRQKSITKRINTVIEPWVDVDADVAAINAGQATRRGDDFIINGRTYRTHGGIGQRLIPVEGPGFHQLDRPTYKVLRVFNSFGNTHRAHRILDNMGITTPQRQLALEVWRLGQ